MARSAASRNRRGCGLPGCGFGVTPPISTKPKPRPSTPLTTSPCRSKPAARPTDCRLRCRPYARAAPEAAGGEGKIGGAEALHYALFLAAADGAAGSVTGATTRLPRPNLWHVHHGSIPYVVLTRIYTKKPQLFGGTDAAAGAHRPDRSKSAMTGAWSEGRCQPRASRSTSAPASAPESAGVAQIWSSRRPRSEADQSRAR